MIAPEVVILVRDRPICGDRVVGHPETGRSAGGFPMTTTLVAADRPALLES
jgi:hypothetical protein